MVPHKLHGRFRMVLPKVHEWFRMDSPKWYKRFHLVPPQVSHSVCAHYISKLGFWCTIGIKQEIQQHKTVAHIMSYILDLRNEQHPSAFKVSGNKVAKLGRLTKKHYIQTSRSSGRKPLFLTASIILYLKIPHTGDKASLDRCG